MKYKLWGIVAMLLILGSLWWLSPTKKNEEVPEEDTGSYPSQILNLKNWKLTLPITESEDSNDPLEIFQPELSKYKIDPWFRASEDKTSVIFRASVYAPTTDNTDYSRSELREMTKDGKEKADWSSSKGIHTMFIDQAITAVPKTKQHVVAGQIHDDDDDVVVIRLEYPNLYINVDGDNEHTLDENYELGKRFTVKFLVKGGITEIYYNNSSSPSYTFEKEYSDAYFKAGVYTQSNCEKEEDPSLCNEDNYGEVEIYNLEVSHR